jgi:hypothetical protein
MFGLNGMKIYVELIYRDAESSDFGSTQFSILTSARKFW